MAGGLESKLMPRCLGHLDFVERFEEVAVPPHTREVRPGVSDAVDHAQLIVGHVSWLTIDVQLGFGEAAHWIKSSIWGVGYL